MSESLGSSVAGAREARCDAWEGTGSFTRTGSGRGGTWVKTDGDSDWGGASKVLLAEDKDAFGNTVNDRTKLAWCQEIDAGNK